MSKIWTTCLSELQIEFSTSDFNTWINPLQAVEENGVLKLLAPNRFVMDWVREHHLAKIDAIVSQICDEAMTIELEIGSKKSPAQIAVKKPKTPEVKKFRSNNLNVNFTFDNFVEGKSNQLAKAASKQVSENIGKAYNPLLIYGGSGLGKTHIMHAIGNAILLQNPTSNIVYLHSERFVQDMVKALQQNSIDTFKEYYRTVDTLLIDDIQFFAGKERSQEEFFHTFNTLLENKHQVVMTCDKYPKEISGLEDRLKSRFGWGLPVPIDPPDLETRAAILIQKAQASQVELDQEVAFFIGKRIPSNVRELEGALSRVIANSQFTGKQITIDFTKDVLHDLIAIQDRLISIENIQKTVAEYFKIRLSDLSSKNRKQSITRPRQIAMTLARELTNLSLPEIGSNFGGRDHTTVINACKRIKELRETDHKVDEDYLNLLRTLSH